MYTCTYILYTYTFYKQTRLVGPTMTKVKKYLVSSTLSYILKSSEERSSLAPRATRLITDICLPYHLRTFIFYIAE